MKMETTTDSRVETYKHIQTVQRLMGEMLHNLQLRQMAHDQSKLTSPEVEVFDEFTPKLATSTYGSDEYKSFLGAMKPALDHHYAANDHHPEHYLAGVKDMTIPALLEMLCDWKAATLRHADGNIRKSIDINQKRFGYSDDVKAILHNTVNAMGW
jgi:hypothetical protein